MSVSTLTAVVTFLQGLAMLQSNLISTNLPDSPIEMVSAIYKGEKRIGSIFWSGSDDYFVFFENEKGESVWLKSETKEPISNDLVIV